jgi:hypothetical protein
MLFKMNRPITRSITNNQRNITCNGYHVYKNWFEVNDNIISLLRKQIDSKRGGPIFNGEKNDKKRLQSNLSCNNKTISNFITNLENTIYNLLPPDSPLCFSNWVILKSLAGCDAQKPHTDYDPNLINKCCYNENYIPLLVLASPMPETYLDIWDFDGNHQKISLDVGDIIIFRANIIHSGSSYVNENIRIHTYLDSPIINRISNRTWFADNFI